jgi:hypothetical protein
MTREPPSWLFDVRACVCRDGHPSHFGPGLSPGAHHGLRRSSVIGAVGMVADSFDAVFGAAAAWSGVASSASFHDMNARQVDWCTGTVA